MYKNYFLKNIGKTKKYMENQKYIYIYIYIFNKLSREEENNIRITHTSTRLLKKIYIGVCFAFIVFMINVANLEINCQFLSLNWTY